MLGWQDKNLLFLSVLQGFAGIHYRILTHIHLLSRMDIEILCKPWLSACRLCGLESNQQILVPIKSLLDICKIGQVKLWRSPVYMVSLLLLIPCHIVAILYGGKSFVKEYRKLFKTLQAITKRFLEGQAKPLLRFFNPQKPHLSQPRYVRWCFCGIRVTRCWRANILSGCEWRGCIKHRKRLQTTSDLQRTWRYRSCKLFAEVCK